MPEENSNQYVAVYDIAAYNYEIAIAKKLAPLITAACNYDIPTAKNLLLLRKSAAY
jgi:hypothetical protein